MKLIQGTDKKLSSAFAQNIKAVLKISASSTSISNSRTELDSHADYPVVGKNAMILYKTEMAVNVTPFSDDFGIMSEVPFVHVSVVYDCPITGNSTILIINNALYIREMENNILPPIMMPLNGLLMDEFPKFVCPNHTIETHYIFFFTENTQLPLALYGTTSYISTRRPNGMSEFNEHTNLVLTSENPVWDPSSSIYAQQESAMTNLNGEIITRKKPNQEVLSIKVPLLPRPKTNTQTAQP